MTISSLISSLCRALQTGLITTSLGLVTFPFSSCLMPPASTPEVGR